MQIDITDFFQNECPRDYSASVAELGQNAGQDTWNAALENAPDYSHWLPGEDERQELRDYLREFGAWSPEEIAAWTNDELLALLIQLISGDIRVGGLDVESPAWEAYEQAAKDGQCPGNIFRGDDGRIYYHVGL